MRAIGTFGTIIDCGELGDLDALVSYFGYRAPVQLEDDFDEISISTVIIIFGGVQVDIHDKLSEGSRESLRHEAWRHFDNE